MATFEMQGAYVGAGAGRAQVWPTALASDCSACCPEQAELDQRAAYIRTTQALAKLKKRGLVGREGRVWLAQ